MWGASYVVCNCTVLGGWQCTVLCGWQLHCTRWLAMYCARWLASVARRECKCFSSLFVWPGPLPLMKSKYRKSRHIHCNIFHTFATNVGDILKVLVKSYFIFGKKCIQIRFHYDYLSRAVSPLKVILHRYNTLLSS